MEAEASTEAQEKCTMRPVQSAESSAKFLLNQTALDLCIVVIAIKRASPQLGRPEGIDSTFRHRKFFYFRDPSKNRSSIVH